MAAGVVGRAERVAAPGPVRHLRVVPQADGRTALGLRVVDRVDVSDAAVPSRYLSYGPGATLAPTGADPLAWRAKARCHGQADLFFPAPDEPWFATQEREKAALAVCATCPVTRQCLSTAFASGEATAVWGGTTPSNRVLLMITERSSIDVSVAGPHPAS